MIFVSFLFNLVRTGTSYGAVGWNPICIIIPCHRVVGANGNLTGYGGGIENKVLFSFLKTLLSEFIYVNINKNK